MKLPLADSFSLPSHRYGRIYEVQCNSAFYKVVVGPDAVQRYHMHSAFAIRTEPLPYALRLFLSLVAQVRILFTVGMEFDCTPHEGHAIK